MIKVCGVTSPAELRAIADVAVYDDIVDRARLGPLGI